MTFRHLATVSSAKKNILALHSLPTYLPTYIPTALEGQTQTHIIPGFGCAGIQRGQVLVSTMNIFIQGPQVLGLSEKPATWELALALFSGGWADL